MKLEELLNEYGEYEIEDLEEVISLLKKPQPKPTSIWGLSIRSDCEYYSIMEDADGAIRRHKWNNTLYDLQKRKYNNAFLTYEDADRELNRRAIEAIMKRHSKGHNYQSGKSNYMICFDGKNVIALESSGIMYVGVIYFSSVIDAIGAIHEIGEKKLIKYYFNNRQE